MVNKRNHLAGELLEETLNELPTDMQRRGYKLFLKLMDELESLQDNEIENQEPKRPALSHEGSRTYFSW